MPHPQEFVQVIRRWAEVFMQRSMRDFREFMEETGLTFPQTSVLMRLRYGGACSVSDLAKKMSISNAAASQLVDRLVQMGHVERREDPHDRRAKILTLTETGQTLVERGINMRVGWLKDLAAALTEEERTHVISALTLLTDAALSTLPAPENKA